METKEIGGKKFVFVLTGRQDELMGLIILEMFKEIPDAISHFGTGALDVITKMRNGNKYIEPLMSGNVDNVDLDQLLKEIESMQKEVVNLSMDMLKAKAWINAKGYLTRIMAILLVPEGEKFDESKIDEHQKFFQEQDVQRAGSEVIDYFFQRSGIFGLGTQAFLPTGMAKK